MTLPDFGHLYATDPPPKPDNDSLPDFSSVYTPQNRNDGGEAKLNELKDSFYNEIGLKPGALRGFIDLIPSALTSVMSMTPLKFAQGVNQAVDNTGQAVESISKDPVGGTLKLASGALEGIVKPFVQYPLELLVNQKVDVTNSLGIEGSGVALTPEERDQRARSIGANAIGWVIGLKAEQMVESGLVGQAGVVGKKGLTNIGEALDQATKSGIIGEQRVSGDIIDQAFSSVPTRDLLRLRDAAIAPEFIRRGVGGVVGGAAGGFSTGYLEGQANQDRIAGGLSYALMAMPLGVAMSSVGALTKFAKPTGDLPNLIAQQASDIAKLRMVNAASDQTIGEILFNLNNMDVTQSMAATIALKQIKYEVAGYDKNGVAMQYGKNASIIPGVETPSEIMRIVAQHNSDAGETRAISVMHTKKDGTVDMMIAPADVPKAEQDFFAQTGFMHGQQVSYGGRDSWVIESQSISEGQRVPRVVIRDLVSGEKIEGLRTKELTRLTSQEPGDLAVHLGRLVTKDDIYDPAQGFNKYGPNNLSNSDKDPFNFNSTALYQSGEVLGEEIKPIFDRDPRLVLMRKEYESLAQIQHNRILTDAESDRFIALEDQLHQSSVVGLPKGFTFKGKQLEPGLNHFQVDDIHETADGKEIKGKKGFLIYIGGKKEMVDVPGPNGNIIQKEVTVGEPGSVVAFLDYKSELGYKNTVLPGSDNFFSLQSAPNRAIATEAMKRMRIELGLNRSLSSLSLGGSQSLANAINRFGPDRQIGGRLTVMTPEAIKTALIEGFLDYVGATPDGNYTIKPEENIAHVQAGYMRSHRGESLDVMKYRMTQNKLADINGQTARFFTDSKRPLGPQETLELLHQQITNNAIPTIRTTADRAIDRTEVSFNDLISGYASAQNINPEAIPAVRGFIESQIGKSLLGMESARSRLADRSLLPMLQNQMERAQAAVTRMEKQIADNGGVMTESRATALNDAKDAAAVFGKRVEQIKNAAPLPFSDVERDVYSRLMTEAQAIRRSNAEDLASAAMANGFAIERNNGVIALRDADSWQLLPQRFSDPEAARDFINATGKAKGIDIDGGGNNMVPPSAVAGIGMLPPEPPPRLFEVPHQFAPDTRMSKVMTFLDTVAPWFTPKRAFMVALDNQFKTRFYSDVYLPLQTAKMKVEAMKRPFLQLVKDLETHLIDNKIDRKRWSLITQYRETSSPPEIIDNLFKDRKLTPDEISYANKLHSDNIDIQNVYSYRRAVKEINKQFNVELNELQDQASQNQDPVAKLGYQKKIVDLRKQNNADIKQAQDVFAMDDKHLAAAQMFDEIQKRSLNEASLFGVTRLASALINNEGTKAEFAAKNNFTPAEIKAANLASAAYSAVAKHLDIDERLTDYFNHFRAFSDIPDATPTRLRNAILRGTINDLPQLAQEMIRSGEMNAYELDPVKALTQYVSTAFNNRHFNDIWKESRNSAVNYLQQIPKGREAAAKVLNEYISGMKNVPAASDQLGQHALDTFMERMGFDARPDIKNGIASTFLAATSGSMLGFRPAQGVRDFTQFAKIYFSRFGMERMNNGLRLAYQRDANGIRMIEKLAQEGTVPGLSILQFASEEELANGIAGKVGRVRDAIWKGSELGLKMSGQHNAYALAHAIAYMDTKDLASRTLLKLSRGEIPKDVAYKQLSMNSYDLPVAEGFDRLVSEGKMPEAAEYLAQATGTETAFVFGLQNHPLGWGTAVGKLAGQFGTWSVWARNYLTRLAGRGTAAERAAAMARFASAEVATGVAGKALGFNMRSWYMLPGIAFTGGPAYEYLQQLEDIAGMRGSQRQALAQKQLLHGPIPVIGSFLPGGSALNDYVQAYQLSQKRFGPIPVLGRGLGFSIDQTGRSFADEMMGNYPALSSR